MPRVTARKCLDVIERLLDWSDQRSDVDEDWILNSSETAEVIAPFVPELRRAVESGIGWRIEDTRNEIFEALEAAAPADESPIAGQTIPGWLLEAQRSRSPSCVASYTRRRTKAEIDSLRTLIYQIVSRDRPMTVRQVFYRLVSADAIGKTESEYNSVVIRLLTEMRLEGWIPFDWLADNTRWMRKPITHGSIRDAMRDTAEFYRQEIWRDLPVYVEIWLEKEALAGVLVDVTRVYDVPLMVTRGYASLSYLHSAAETIAAKGKPTFIYYFGDHDPSGQDISANVEPRLREFAPGTKISFERIAVTPQQVADWDLPSRPTKKTDTRARNFAGESTEVDAIEPDKLRELARDCIERHIPDGHLDVIEAAEKSEREIGLKMLG